MIRVKLDTMYGDDFIFETIEAFTEAAVFFVTHKKSFSVSFVDCEKEDEVNDDK